MSKLAILGGDPVRRGGFPDWPVSDEADLTHVAAVVTSGRWGGHPYPGPFTERYAERFGSFQGASHVIPMANGTITMEVALKALGIGWGDEVIVPALTFSATAYAAMAAGALPVLVDVTAESWVIDPDAVEAAITSRTRAIMPVHLGQQMADMDRIGQIAERHDLAVIEDCAHSHGKAWRGRGAGTIGTFGSFSHQSTKLLTSGEGGTLTTEDAELAEIATSIIDCGRAKDPAGQRNTFGANYRLSELQAALLVSQLEKLPAQVAERAANVTYFEERVRSEPGIRLLQTDPRISRTSFYRYMIAMDPEAFAGVTNEVVAAALSAEGLETWVAYPSLTRDPLFQPWLSRLPVAVEYADRLRPEAWDCPVADRAGSRESLYIDEAAFRDGQRGVDDAIAAIAKVRDGAAALASRAAAAVGA